MGFLSSLFGGGGGTYTHLDYSRDIKKDTAPLRFLFKSPANILLDEINLLTKNSGNRNIAFYVSILDSKGKATIGKKVIFYKQAGVFSSEIVKGLSATLIKGRSYILEFGHVKEDISLLTAAARGSTSYITKLELFGYSVIDPVWRIKLTNGYVSIGGYQSYKSNGVFIRTFDVKTPKTNIKTDGNFYFSDILPVGTLINIDLYFTDSDAISQEPSLINWDFFQSAVIDGTTIPKHRYWRAYVTFESNKLNDQTPELSDMEIQYRSLPKTFGTIVENKTKKLKGYFLKAKLPMVASVSELIYKNGSKSLSSFNLSSAKVNPKFQVSIGGGFSSVISEDKNSTSTFNKNLTARESRIRVGYRSVKSTFTLYKAAIKNCSYSKGKFNITAEDSSALLDIKIPSSKAAVSWSSTTSYVAGSTSVFFGALYSSITNNTNKQPDLNPTDWNAIGGAWQDIIYNNTTSVSGEWHLADIIRDIISNKVNIHDSMIDKSSFENVKLLLPLRTGSITITKPVSAKSIIEELSWLLESHLIVLNNKISLVREPNINEINTSFDILKSDILENSLVYKSGWNNVVNEIIMLTGYDNSSDSNPSNFKDGVVLVDADSVKEFGTVKSQIFKDRFNTNDLQTRAQVFVNKWKNGRSSVSFSTSISKIQIETMDIVNLKSNQLPDFTFNEFSGIIVSKDIDWLSQKIKFTAIEIK